MGDHKLFFRGEGGKSRTPFKSVFEHFEKLHFFHLGPLLVTVHTPQKTVTGAFQRKLLKAENFHNRGYFPQSGKLWWIFSTIVVLQRQTHELAFPGLRPKDPPLKQ